MTTEMKSVLASIKPKYCELIANGKKTVELRKTRPKIDTPFKVYMYCTKQYYRKGDGYFQGKYCGEVMGEFVCDKITDFEGEFWNDEIYERIQKIVKDGEHYTEYEYETVATNEDEKYKENWLCKQSCVSWEELRKYVGLGLNEFYAWHISNLVVYDKPRELSEFYKENFDEIYSSWEDLFSIGVPTDCIVKYPPEPKKEDYVIKRPPQSWCYVEVT